MLIIPVQDATVLLNMFVAIIWHFNQQGAALSTSQILTLENGWTNCETATAVVRPLLAGMTVITTRQQQNQQTTADCLSTQWCSVHYSVATNAMFTSLLTTRTLWLMKKFYFCFDFGPTLQLYWAKSQLRVSNRVRDTGQKKGVCLDRTIWSNLSGLFRIILQRTCQRQSFGKNFVLWWTTKPD